MNLNWIKKYDFKLVALLILLVFIFGVVCYIPLLSFQEKESDGPKHVATEKLSITDVDGFTNGTVILTATFTAGNESAQIISSILKDSQGNTIEVVDSMHEEIPFSEETRVSVTFDAENIQFNDDYKVILCSKKDSSFVSPSFKFSNTD